MIIKNVELSNEISSLNQIIQELNASIAEIHSKNESVVAELNKNIDLLNLTIGEKNQQLNLNQENDVNLFF